MAYLQLHRRALLRGGGGGCGGCVRGGGDDDDCCGGGRGCDNCPALMARVFGWLHHAFLCR